MTPTARSEITPPRSSGLVAALAVGAVGVALAAGYVGFRTAARLDLGGEAGAGLVALAAVTGAAVVFSPCSFPLVVTLLAGSDQQRERKRRSDGVRSALAIAAGSAAFLLLAGGAVGLAGEGLAATLSFSSPGGRLLRGGVAAVLVGAGLVQLGVIALPLARVAALAAPLEHRRAAVATTHRRRAQAMYGFAFVLAGFG